MTLSVSNLIMTINKPLCLLLSLFLFAGIGAAQNEQENTLPKCSEAKSTESYDNIKLISFGVSNSRAINLVTPDYPKAARKANISGKVYVSVVIDQKGCVIDAKATSGHPIFFSGSIKAALQSTFKPITISGKQIMFRAIICYGYVNR